MVELIKGEHIIHIAGITLAFILFSNAGADEYQNRPGILFAQHLTMGLHRRKNGGQIGKGLRIMFFNELYDGGTAGGNDGLVPMLCHQTLIFRFHQIGPRSRFLGIQKPSK